MSETTAPVPEVVARPGAAPAPDRVAGLPPDLLEATDNALARRAGMGDREAFTVLFARHAEATHRFALRMLDSERTLADEVVQEAWVKVWRKLPDFEGRAAFTTWVFSIVSRQALDLRRRRRPLAVDDELLEPLVHRGSPPRADGDPHAAAVAGQLWETLLLALGELPWRQKAAWLLREVEGMSYAEIAGILETSETVVRGQLHRARRTLAIRMEQWR